MTPRPLEDRARSARQLVWRSRAHTTIMSAVALVTAAVVSSCSSGGAGGGGFSPPPTPVEVVEVNPRVVRDQFRAIGSIEAVAIIEVASELNAVVQELPFREGQFVSEGTLIARLDDREFRAEADRAEAQRELATSNAERSRRLYDEEVISKQDLDDALTSLKVAEANEALSKARLDKTRVTAPFGGLIGRRKVSPGQYLRSGDLITELARVNQMKVVFAAPERFMGEIRRQGGVAVTTPAYPGESFNGKIDVVDPIIDPRTRTVIFVAKIPNRGSVLRPGMSADVIVTFAERPNALAVPQEAVFAEGEGRFVYLVNPDSTVARVAVELGTRDSMQVEVVSGLEPGSMVVRAGHQKLYPGAKVMPVSPGAAGGPGGPGAAAGGPGGAPGGGGEGDADAATPQTADTESES